MKSAINTGETIMSALHILTKTHPLILPPDASETSTAPLVKDTPDHDSQTTSSA
jgi:hypothetical protein